MIRTEIRVKKKTEEVTSDSTPREIDDTVQRGMVKSRALANDDAIQVKGTAK